MLASMPAAAQAQPKCTPLVQTHAAAGCKSITLAACLPAGASSHSIPCSATATYCTPPSPAPALALGRMSTATPTLGQLARRRRVSTCLAAPSSSGLACSQSKSSM